MRNYFRQFYTDYPRFQFLQLVQEFRNTKIGMFLIGIIRMMFLIQSVICAECMCCENVISSKFPSFS